MKASFQLPDLGEGVHEAEILTIPVSPGQTIKEGDIILEIETDKAAVEIPSPFTGTVTDINVKVGDTALVGDVLMTFSTAEKADPPATSTAPKTSPDSPHDTEKKRPVPAAPSTRKLARELGVDLHAVTPTGAGGVVTKDDVIAHADNKEPLAPKPAAADKPEPVPASPGMESSASTPLPDFSKWGPVENQPFRSVRKATANRMAASWAQIPHVHCMDDVDITKLEAFRQKHKEDIAAAGGRMTMTIFAMKAVATALKTFPLFNSSLDLNRQEIIIKHYFHIGIAVDSKGGLMVPVVRDVDRKSIKELAIEVHGAINRVRQGEHSREELLGGTFTITNAGALGGSRFSAIINHPEVAILGLGQGRMQPAVITDERGRHEIVPRLIMPIVLCFDHRVVDGGDAIRFLRLVIDALEDPDELLITMI